MKKPVAIEIFCGVGGMTLGFERAGFNVVAAFDNDDRNVEYHTINFPHSRTFKADVKKLKGADVLKLGGLETGSIDVLFGGPPCQGFSEIGRKEDGDKRNLLILEFARLVRELRPRYFVVENVRGLLYSYSSAILASFIRRVRAADYDVIEPIKLLDATHFGVPQKRKRAFILGYRRDVAPPQYPLAIMHSGEIAKPPTVSDAIADLPDVSRLVESDVNDKYVGKLGEPSSYAKMLRAKPENGYPIGDGALSGCLRTIHTAETIKRFLATTPGTYE